MLAAVIENLIVLIQFNMTYPNDFRKIALNMSNDVIYNPKNNTFT